MTKTIHTSAYVRLLAALRLKRETLGKSQSEIALRLGWTQRKLSYAESGERRLDVLEFFALAEALEIDTKEAFALIQSQIGNAPRTRTSKRPARG